MIRHLLIATAIISLSACTISNDPNWGKPKKTEVKYKPFIVKDGVYLCVYDIEPDHGPSLLMNNSRVKRPPTAVLGVERKDDYTAAVILGLDTGAKFEGNNLERLKPERNITTYQQSPSPSDMGNSYYFLGIKYFTDDNGNLEQVWGMYRDVSYPAMIIAKCVEAKNFKNMISKPNFGYY